MEQFSGLHTLKILDRTWCRSRSQSRLLAAVHEVKPNFLMRVLEPHSFTKSIILIHLILFMRRCLDTPGTYWSLCVTVINFYQVTRFICVRLLRLLLTNRLESTWFLLLWFRIIFLPLLLIFPYWWLILFLNILDTVLLLLILPHISITLSDCPGKLIEFREFEETL